MCVHKVADYIRVQAWNRKQSSSSVFSANFPHKKKRSKAEAIATRSNSPLHLKPNSSTPEPSFAELTMNRADIQSEHPTQIAINLSDVVSLCLFSAALYGQWIIDRMNQFWINVKPLIMVFTPKRIRSRFKKEILANSLTNHPQIPSEERSNLDDLNEPSLL